MGGLITAKVHKKLSAVKERFSWIITGAVPWVCAFAKTHLNCVHLQSILHFKEKTIRQEVVEKGLKRLYLKVEISLCLR